MRNSSNLKGYQCKLYSKEIMLSHATRYTRVFLLVYASIHATRYACIKPYSCIHGYAHTDTIDCEPRICQNYSRRCPLMRTCMRILIALPSTRRARLFLCHIPLHKHVIHHQTTLRNLRAIPLQLMRHGFWQRHMRKPQFLASRHCRTAL
jgi:hypothetical protein